MIMFKNGLVLTLDYKGDQVFLMDFGHKREMTLVYGRHVVIRDQSQNIHQ